MSPRKSAINRKRKLQFEQFEQRLVMSAQAVSNILPELDIASPAITQQSVMLDHAPAEVADDAEPFGFDGTGQTVAVIDSGIAWDHYALGGGFGEGHKVVGGWDFAENDANPYDDGPAGFHGTHVAGIIGSSDDQFRGVSSGVDLVGLRVFGDNGEGDLKWVEEALKWVHKNIDSFANPITTVNLSLGTNWDPDNTPDWATLDDEFEQLKAEGLFISVSAGNNFSRLGQEGLSYPAVSPHVVPVASHGDDGLLSDFSQRDRDVLVAPGELIQSTVPRHLLGGPSDTFLGSSGTSMSAPVVAGASALLRQANEFMGIKDVNQDLLYQQFRDTADQIYDSITGNFYYRLNLEAALNAVVTDRHADTPQQATRMGTLGGGEHFEGTIGTLDDLDHMRFTAQTTGRMTFQLEVTDQLLPLVEVNGSAATIADNVVTFDVVAGQEYLFSIGTLEGIGHYRIDVDIQPSTSLVNWGRVISHQFNDIHVAGESLFQMTTLRKGILTVQADATVQPGENLVLEIYDSRMNRLQTVDIQSGEFRLDVTANAGERFYLKAIGNADSVDFQTTNLVSLNSGTLRINGTHQANQISINSTTQFAVQVNGVDYQFNSSDIHRVIVHGYRGQDAIDVVLGNDDHQITVKPHELQLTNQHHNVSAYGFENVNIAGGSGKDTATLFDSQGNDHLNSWANPWGQRQVILTGSNYRHHISEFELIHAVTTGGYDTAAIVGTSADESFASRGNRNTAWINNSRLLMDHFDSVHMDGAGGNDRAELYDSPRQDRFELSPTAGSLANDTFHVRVQGFERINAYSDDQQDSIRLEDSAGDDVFFFIDQRSVMRGQGYQNVAFGFTDISANSSLGMDVSTIYDTTNNDYFTVDANHSTMFSSGLRVSSRGFDWAAVRAENGGYDRARVWGTGGNDTIESQQSRLRITNSNGTIRQLTGVEHLQLDSLGGHDQAGLMGSENRETLRSTHDEIEFESTLQMLRMINVQEAHFDGNGGPDEVLFDELGELDLLESLGDQARVYRQNQMITAEEFALLEARTVDNAIARYNMDDVDFLYMLRGGWLEK